MKYAVIVEQRHRIQRGHQSAGAGIGHIAHGMLKTFRQGKFVIVVDDEDRENEGDLIVAAEKITPEQVNFIGHEFAAETSLPHLRHNPCRNACGHKPAHCLAQSRIRRRMK